MDKWSRIAEIEAWSPGSNVAAATKGGIATASSSYSPDYPTTAVNDGDRKGLNPGAGGYWNDATSNEFADWVQINFAGSKTITEIDVYTLQDTYTTPIDPTASMSFSTYGITDVDVQYWDGSAWVTVPGGSISGNRQVWRRITFPALTTDRIRVVVNGAIDMWSRIVEIEAWGN